MEVVPERPGFDSLKDVLSLAVRGAPFESLLQRLLQSAQDVTGTDARAALYVADDDGATLRLAAAAGLAPAFMEAIATLPVGVNEAACGRAVALGAPVLVGDVLEEPRLAPYLPLADIHGIRACWSFPLPSPGGRIMGTLAFYHRAPCLPDPALAQDLAWFADLAALVIDRHLRDAENARREHESQSRMAALAAESERRRRLYEAALDNTPDLVYVFDLDHRFTYANEVLLRMWGRSWDEAIGKNCRELGYPEWHAAMHDREIEQVKETGKPIRGEVPFEGAFGRRVYDYIFAPVFGPDGDVEAVAGTTRDVTERKQFEDDLMASRLEALAAARVADNERQRLEAFLEAVPVGIGYADTTGRLVRVNAENRRLWGDVPAAAGTDDYVRWRAWWADGSGRDGRELEAHEWGLARALRGEEVTGDLIEIERFDAARSRRNVLLRATPVRDGDGNVTGAVVAQMDMTEQLRAEAALRESEQRFRTITNAMPQMVWTALPDGAVDYHNQQFEEFIGMRAEDGDGAGDTGWADRYLHPDDREAALAAWRHSVATQTPYELTCRARHRSGEYRWILARALPLHDAAGRLVKWLGTDTDIHANKLAEDALAAANQRKDEFLAMLAHELRNPLAPISAAAQVLRLTADDPARVRSYADVIARQVNHMTTLVNDLLDVSRVTRGMVQFEHAPVDLKSVVTSAAEQVQPLVEAHRHTLTLELGPAPAIVAGDRARLIQVVANLLANAAKYTPAGGRIALSMQPAAGRVAVRVTDNGSGIEPALLPHVFDLFTQGERTPDRAQGGLGLGLALARTIVDAHGGAIRAASAGAGHGSTFTVELPLGAPGGGEPPERRAALRRDGKRGGDPRHIMLVDDNADAAATLTALLEAAGHRVTLRASPAQALADAAQLAPDAFILDIGMPGMDGWELAQRLRAQDGCAGALYIALSGYGQPQDRERSREAGFDHHLVKPVDAGSLLALLDAHRAAV